uniref:RNA polymerase alpha subunit n=1 Tax=Lepocinclis playfairiana TaxID=1403386 RepID=A0A3G3LLH7_9EUGL|nr:RNA polymerase alpha subunit [Lepocinclis playfairiana]AYQ93560.1 RNA polymerase alpha subunit [Lepocinclis playfairiana]
MRLYKLSVSRSFRTVNCFFSVFKFQSVSISKAFSIGNLVRSFLIREKLTASNILFFVKTLSDSFSSRYRLVSEFSDFEQLGSSFKELHFAVRQLEFEIIGPNLSSNLWKGYLEICGKSAQFDLNMIQFFPKNLRILNSKILTCLNCKSLCMKLVFQVRLCLFLKFITF